MRNPDRINEILKALEKLWKQQPDLRFGQLVSNINFYENNGSDMFYIEDEKWLSWFKKWNEKIKYRE